MATITKSDMNGEDFSQHVDEVISEQREYFRSGATKSYQFRKTQLQRLKKLIEENEPAINQALFEDLGRSEFLSAFTLGAVISEIKYALDAVLTLRPPFITRRLNQWMRPQKKRSPMLFMGNKVTVQQVPKGVVLIIGPWNYPVMLILAPLIGAIAGGNCVVIKPSEFAPKASEVVTELINSNFDRKYIHVLEGAAEEGKILTAKPNWDHIFFTGGTEIGRKIYQEAAKNLIPVTLELGGKSPTIVDKDIHLDLTAKRLVQVKFLNAGQTCMAPDYVFVHKDVKDELIALMLKYLKQYFGEDKLTNPDYSTIVDRRHFDRLLPLIESGTKVTDAKVSAEELHIDPIILDDVKFDDAVMQEEIFGPILPLIPWEDEKEIIEYIESNPHPLALYIYTKDKAFRERILNNTTHGSATINDSVLYYLHPEVPFGGVGDSGFGNYTGKYGFETFTRARPVIEAGRLVDRVAEKLGVKFFRYPPASKLKVKLLKLVQRTLSRIRY